MNAYHQIGLGLIADDDDLARCRAEKKAERKARKERGRVRRPRTQTPKCSLERAMEIQKRNMDLVRYEVCFNGAKKMLIKLVEDGRYDEALDILVRHRRMVSHLNWRIFAAERAYKKALTREGK